MFQVIVIVTVIQNFGVSFFQFYLRYLCQLDFENTGREYGDSKGTTGTDPVIVPGCLWEIVV